jgi:hypothetical protein
LAVTGTSDRPPKAVLIMGIIVPAICVLALAIVVPVAVSRRLRPLGLEDSWNDPRRYTIDSDLNNA